MNQLDEFGSQIRILDSFHLTLRESVEQKPSWTVLMVQLQVAPDGTL